MFPFFLFLNRSFSFLRHCCVFVHCISSILADFVCFLCRSLSFLLQLFNFFIFVSRSFSYLRHCCIFVFRCCSFSLLRCCYLIIFRSSTVFRQFSPTLFAFSVVLCLSLSVVLSRTYVTAIYLSFAVFLSLSYVTAVLLSFVRPLYFVNSL